MLMVPANARLFLYEKPVSMNKSFEGLSGIVQEMFPGELLSGAFFIFLSRLKDHMKVLYWDGDGFVIFYKRLEKGSFSAQKNGARSMGRKEFLMLLEGITPKRLQTRFSL